MVEEKEHAGLKIVEVEVELDVQFQLRNGVANHEERVKEFGCFLRWLIEAIDSISELLLKDSWLISKKGGRCD